MLYIISAVARNSYLIVIVFRALRSTFGSDVTSILDLITKSRGVNRMGAGASNGGIQCGRSPVLKALLYFIAGSMPPASAPRELEGAGGEICGDLGLEVFNAERHSSGCLLILFFFLLYFLLFFSSA